MLIKNRIIQTQELQHSIYWKLDQILYFEAAQGPEPLNSRKHKNVTGNVSLYLKNEKLWNTSGSCQ